MEDDWFCAFHQRLRATKSRSDSGARCSLVSLTGGRIGVCGPIRLKLRESVVKVESYINGSRHRIFLSGSHDLQWGLSKSEWDLKSQC
jgi:hypothetical protein